MKQIKFLVGFSINGMMYGWYRNNLYRLPQKKRYELPIKKLTPIKIGKVKGYRVNTHKKTQTQLLSITKNLNKPIKCYINV